MLWDACVPCKIFGTSWKRDYSYFDTQVGTYARTHARNIDCRTRKSARGLDFSSSSYDDSECEINMDSKTPAAAMLDQGKHYYLLGY